MSKNLKIAVAIIAIISILLFVLTGCGKDSEEVPQLDMNKINENLRDLKGESFDIFTAETNIMLSGVEKFDVLEMLYDFDFKEFGINPDNLSEYRFNMDKTSKDMWVVFLPISGQKNAVITEMNNYIQKLISDEEDESIKTKLQNYSYEEIEDYLVWVVSNDNQKILEITKGAKASVLPIMMEITADTMKDELGLDPNLVEEFAIKEPAMITTSTTYMVVKPAKGKKSDVKSALDSYMTTLETQWSTYLPDQYDLVKNRMYKEYGDYLIYIVSENNDLIYNTIINSTK